MKLVEQSVRNNRIKSIIFFSVFVIMGVMIIFYDESYEDGINVYYIIFSVLMIIWMGANLYSIFAITPYKIIGDIAFKTKKIIILNQEIPIDDIILLKFNYSTYGGRSTSFDSFSVTYGHKNYISIKTKKNKNYRYNLLLEKRSDYARIYRIFEAYKDIGVNVEFYDNRELVMKNIEK